MSDIKSNDKAVANMRDAKSNNLSAGAQKVCSQNQSSLSTATRANYKRSHPQRT
jgi:hypothetical protein